MPHSRLILLMLTVVLTACIGEDLVDDFVPERLTVLNPIDSLTVGQNHVLSVKFFNNAGQETPATVVWRSSNPALATVDAGGKVQGIAPGPVQVIAQILDNGRTLADTVAIAVFAPSTNNPPPNPGGNPTTINGNLRSTSSYVLTGAFSLATGSQNRLILSLADNYVADTNLPGLFVYLTNNPNSIANALELGRVQVFRGAHQYVLPAAVQLNSYSHILYWCKPFSVKVGDGQLK